MIFVSPFCGVSLNRPFIYVSLREYSVESLG